jgi:hypothetical protein
MTWHNQSAPDDQHRTAVHHSCDPLGAGHAFILGMKSKGVALKVMRTFAIK